MIKKKGVDPNLLIAIGVLLASCAGLFIYYKQAQIMSQQTKILLEQTKATAWPQLSIHAQRGFEGKAINKYLYIVENGGTGPAIIQGTEITYDGKVVKTWKEFYEALEVPDSIFAYHGNSVLYDKIVQPQESYMVIDWSGNEDLMPYVFEHADKIKIKICYKSVYNDYYVVERNGLKSNLEKNKRQEVDSCFVRQEFRFQE